MPYQPPAPVTAAPYRHYLLSNADPGTRMSSEVLSAGWPAIADDLRKYERDRRVAAAVAENDALMLSAEREKAFDGDAADARSARTVYRLAVCASAVCTALTIWALVAACEAMS